MILYLASIHTWHSGSI